MELELELLAWIVAIKDGPKIMHQSILIPRCRKVSKDKVFVVLVATLLFTLQRRF